MAVYDLEEQEQISELKAWWAQYGNFIVTLAVVAALASVGWQAWNWYQNRNAAEAGALYYAVQQAVEKNEPQKAREAAGRLVGEHGGSVGAQQRVPIDELVEAMAALMFPEEEDEEV